MTVEIFRKEIRSCKSWKEVYFLLKSFNSEYGYGLTANNSDIPYKDIIFTSTGLRCAFYMTGGRTYRTIKGFANGLTFWNLHHIRKGQYKFSLIIEDDSFLKE